MSHPECSTLSETEVYPLRLSSKNTKFTQLELTSGAENSFHLNLNKEILSKTQLSLKKYRMISMKHVIFIDQEISTIICSIMTISMMTEFENLIYDAFTRLLPPK